jgi:hypothetical protein
MNPSQNAESMGNCTEIVFRDQIQEKQEWPLLAQKSQSNHLPVKHPRFAEMRKKNGSRCLIRQRFSPIHSITVEQDAKKTLMSLHVF